MTRPASSSRARGQHREPGRRPARPAQDRYDGAVANALVPATWALAAAAVLVGAAFAIPLSGPDLLGVLLAYGLAAALLAAVAVAAQLHRLPAGASQPVLAGALSALSVAAVVSLAVTGDPAHTVVVMTVVLACGVLLLSVRWTVGALYVAFGGWLVAAVLSGQERWPLLLTGMVLACVLAALAAYLRRRDVDTTFQAQERADAAAVRDPLTGLANRRGLAMLGAQILENSRRQGDAVHCTFVDVVGLGGLSDDLGPDVGHEVLVSVAEALRAVTRGTDAVARWGGSQFCVVGPGPGMPPPELERRVREHVRLHPPVEESLWSPRVSAGAAMLAPWDSGSLDTLLGMADREMALRRALRREALRPAGGTAERGRSARSRTRD